MSDEQQNDNAAAPEQANCAVGDGSASSVDAAFMAEWANMFPVGDDGGLSPTAVHIAMECFRRGALWQACQPNIRRSDTP